MEKLEGFVEGVIYENTVNGYTVCDVSSGDHLYTLTGYMPGISEGERISAVGEWKNHPEYGEQFSVQYYERIMPESESEIELYLGSGILPHIGKSTARKIVETFGKDALDVIEHEPEKLTQIRGISVAKAQEIYKKYVEHMGLKNIIVFFQRFNVSPGLSVKAYKTFGERVTDAVVENPFILTAIDGFTFRICDKIRETLNLPLNFVPRVCSGVVSTLLNAGYLSGHTFLPKGMLVAQTKALLEVDQGEVEDAIAELCLKKELILESGADFDAVYLDTFYEAECGVANRLKEMSSVVFQVSPSEVNSLIDRAEAETDIILADAQRNAVYSAFENSAMVITGGPGTGKTTIINTIINIMTRQGKNVVLAAPTGRAAKRMSEVCGKEAKTIHRLLENMSSEGGVSFGKNERNKLDCDVLIVDEMSMVDILLMYNLLLALPRKARLIMVGDCDQLPSVGAGNVLRNIIESDALECIRLTDVFRQAKESMIVVNAHRINRGDMPFCNDADTDFFMVNCSNQDYACELIADLCEKRIPKAYGVDSVSQIQVLTPTRKSVIGVRNLNEVLQKRLNPKNHRVSEKTVGSYTFRIGDKVMQNKNNYNLEWTRISDLEKGQGVFNGDVGYVTDINIPKRTLTVVFDDDKKVKYDFLGLDELELAYAVTVHKSQGSEFDVVIMPVLETHRLLMTRNLLYTAITRAKKLVILVGKEAVLKQFVDNNNILMRYSGLKERMIIR